MSCRLSWKSFLDGLDDTALADENTVQELTLILGADRASLAELGAAEGNGLLVDTFEDEFVLNVSSEADLAAGLHNNLLDVATTEEVLELNKGSVLSDVCVNGEMSVYESHLVLDTFAGSVDHGVEESVHSLDLTLLLVGAEPHADSNGLSEGTGLGVLLGHASHINVQVAHVLGNLATRSLNDNNSSLDSNGNIFRDN